MKSYKRVVMNLESDFYDKIFTLAHFSNHSSVQKYIKRLLEIALKEENERRLLGEGDVL